MRDTRVDNITAAVQQSWGACSEARLKELLTKLIPYLHDYLKDAKPTHDEWLAGLNFLTEAAKITDDKRNEFSLLSDVLGITSLVDLQNASEGATIGSPLGPFYVEGSPEIPLGGDIAKDNNGDVVLLSGTVFGQSGEPLKGASIDLWQTDANGLYAVQDDRQHPENLRCKQNCDENGRYWLTTVLPAPYTIPMDGPVGALFQRTGRSEWRPAHYHVIVSAPGYRSIVTELFFDDDKYIASDAIFGVREPLVCQVKDVTTDTDLPSPLSRQPTKTVSFDFNLVRAF